MVKFGKKQTWVVKCTKIEKSSGKIHGKKNLGDKTREMMKIG